MVNYFCLVVWLPCCYPGVVDLERAGHPVEDHQQRNDQRLQPVSRAHTNTGAIAMLALIV